MIDWCLAPVLLVGALHPQRLLVPCDELPADERVSVCVLQVAKLAPQCAIPVPRAKPEE